MISVLLSDGGRDRCAVRMSGRANCSPVDIEERVPQSHPLRLIRRIVNDVLVF